MLFGLLIWFIVMIPCTVKFRPAETVLRSKRVVYTTRHPVCLPHSSASRMTSGSSLPMNNVPLLTPTAMNDESMDSTFKREGTIE